MKNAIAIISFVITISAHIPYIISIAKKRAKPERISWLLWTALDATYLSNAIQNGGVVLFPLAGVLASGVTFLLALRYGVGGKSWFDRICLVVAVVSLVLLLVVENPLYGLGLAMLIDAIGAILTIRKLLKDRTSEPKLVWAALALSPILSLIALENYSIENLLPLGLLIITNGTIFLIAKSKGKAKSAKSSAADSEEIENL